MDEGGEINDLTECATINDLILGKGSSVTPEDIVLTGQKDFSYRLVRNKMNGEHGQRVEDALETICHRLFGCDFVLRSPQLIEESGTKELTDILVVVDDTVIVIQSKSLAIDISDLNITKIGRIQKRQKEAKRQLNTILNAHIRGAQVRATTPIDLTFDIDWSLIKRKIGLITLHIPDDLYSDPNLRFRYPYLVEEHKGIIVHTFLVKDLSQMTCELSTPADVMLYLALREKCVLSRKFVIENELDFLALFKTQYPEIEKTLSEPTYHLVVKPGLWERYRTNEKNRIELRDRLILNSGVIDRLVRGLRASVEYSATFYGLTHQETALNYVRLIGKLGKLTRMERAKIGDIFMTKIEKTRSSKWGYFMYVSEIANTAYLFLFINQDEREKRKDFLKFLCIQACHSVNCTELVGIAITGAQQKDFSMDSLVWNVPEVRSETTPEKDFKMFKQPVHEKTDEWGS